MSVVLMNTKQLWELMKKSVLQAITVLHTVPIETKGIVRKIRQNILHMEVVFKHVLTLRCYYLIITENYSNF